GWALETGVANPCTDLPNCVTAPPTAGGARSQSPDDALQAPNRPPLPAAGVDPLASPFPPSAAVVMAGFRSSLAGAGTPSRAAADGNAGSVAPVSRPAALPSQAFVALPQADAGAVPVPAVVTPGGPNGAQTPPAVTATVGGMAQWTDKAGGTHAIPEATVQI